MKELRLRSLKEVKIIQNLITEPQAKCLFVMLKIHLFNHLVTEVNSKPTTLSGYSAVFKRLKNAPFSPFSL